MGRTFDLRKSVDGSNGSGKSRISSFVPSSSIPSVSENASGMPKTEDMEMIKEENDATEVALEYIKDQEDKKVEDHNAALNSTKDLLSSCH